MEEGGRSCPAVCPAWSVAKFGGDDGEACGGVSRQIGAGNRWAMPLQAGAGGRRPLPERAPMVVAGSSGSRGGRSGSKYQTPAVTRHEPAVDLDSVEVVRFATRYCHGSATFVGIGIAGPTIVGGRCRCHSHMSAARSVARRPAHSRQTTAVPSIPLSLCCALDQLLGATDRQCWIIDDGFSVAFG